MYQDYVSEKDRAFAREFKKFLSRNLASFGRASKFSMLSLAQTFVNGRMFSTEATGREKINVHRYLQQEMFKVCLAFVGQIAKNYQQGYYDERNEWA